MKMLRASQLSVTSAVSLRIDACGIQAERCCTTLGKRFHGEPKGIFEQPGNILNFYAEAKAYLNRLFNKQLIPSYQSFIRLTLKLVFHTWIREAGSVHSIDLREICAGGSNAVHSGYANQASIKTRVVLFLTEHPVHHTQIN